MNVKYLQGRTGDYMATYRTSHIITTHLEREHDKWISKINGSVMARIRVCTQLGSLNNKSFLQFVPASRDTATNLLSNVIQVYDNIHLLIWISLVVKVYMVFMS